MDCRGTPRRRIAITSLALAVLGSMAILAVVRVWLTRPLAEVLSGVRQLGGPQPPRPIAIAPALAAQDASLPVGSKAPAAVVDRLEVQNGNGRTLVRFERHAPAEALPRASVGGGVG